VTRTSTPWPLAHAALARRVGDAVDVAEVVHDDLAQAHLDRARDLGVGLVVAVQQHALGREAAAQADEHLPHRRGVVGQAVLREPARHGGAGEGLGRVVDAGAGERGGERVAEGRGAGPEVRLVQDVRGGAVLGGEGLDVDPADRHGTAGVAAHAR
jgi:hypothetical protein